MKRPLCIVCFAFVVTIFIFYNIKPIPLDDYGGQRGNWVIVTGKVYDKQVQNNKVIIFISSVSTGQSTKQFQKIMCQIETDQKISMGQWVTLRGKVEPFLAATNPGQFDAHRFYQIQGISYKLIDASLIGTSKEWSLYKEKLFEIKTRIGFQIDKIMPEKYAGIVKTMLLGNKSELDKNTKNLYRQTGIAHILAISGMHISFLGMGLYECLRRAKVPNVIASVVAIVGMLQFGMMVGMSASAYRAIIMFSMQLLARLWRRTYDTLTALAVASVMVLMEQPRYIYHTGFLLSFGAIMGIVYIYPILFEVLGQVCLNKHGEKIVKAGIFSLSITIFNLPIILWNYYVIPPYATLINIIIIPCLIVVLSCSVISIGISFIWIFLSKICAIPSVILLFLIEKVAQLSMYLPANQWIIGKPELLQIFLCYLFMFSGVCAFVFHKKKLAFVAIVLSVIVVIISFPSKANITMLDVGQGDCTIIADGKGNCFIIDGGSSSEVKIGEYKIIPFLKHEGISKVSCIFISHMDKDHMNGIRELILLGKKEGIEILSIVMSKNSMKENLFDAEFEQFIKEINAQNINITLIEAGDIITKGNLNVTCLHPSQQFGVTDKNEQSLVLKIKLGNFVGLFTGDISSFVEQEIINYFSIDEQIQLLKVSHHGSKNATSEVFLKRIMPDYAFISCGRNNSYGHPSKEVLKRLEQVGSQIYTTKDNGAITIQVSIP